MSINFTKISDVLLDSKILLDDQAELLALFSTVEDEKLKQFLDLFSNDPEWIEKISQNYKTKKEIFANGNSNE